MNPESTSGIALLGYGGIGRIHALNYRQIPFLYPSAVPRPELTWIYTAHEETARRGAEEAEARRWTTALDNILSDTATTIADITLPNHVHRDVILQLLEAGKHVYCEKPLAATLADARAIAGAVQRARKVKNTVFAMTFQYRFVPAIRRAAEIIRAGGVGRVYSFRAEYLHSGYQNPAKPLSWRLRKEEGGSGALGDLGSHIIDLVRYLLGDFSAVQGHMETFIERRPVAPNAVETGRVTVDDAVWMRCRLVSGAVGTLEASRFATGTLDDLRLWIYGEKGSLHFSLMDPNYLWYFEDDGGSDGWTRLHSVQHFPGAAAPPGRAPLGWSRLHGENQYRFLRAVHRAVDVATEQAAAPEDPADAALPGIEDGLAVQCVLDAVERSYVAGGGWIDVPTA